MSMNLTLDVVTRSGTVIPVEVIHTPTEITFDILNSDDKLAAYEEYVKRVYEEDTAYPWEMEKLKKIKKMKEDPDLTLEWGMI